MKLEAKTKEQREWIKNFVNSLPFFNGKTLRCNMVLPESISIVWEDSVCVGSVWDEKTIRHTLWIDFEDMSKIVDYLREQNNK